MDTAQKLKTLMIAELGLDEAFSNAGSTTALLGHMPELDSMAVVTILNAIELEFDVVIADDDITAEIFETLGSLTTFVDQLAA